MGFCVACTAATPTSKPTCARCGADPDLVSPERLGTMQTRYRLDRRLGLASGRTTWRATRSYDGMQVVLKECLLPRRTDQKVRELAQREASVLTSLEHPQIPRFVDHWITSDDSSSWLVLEYVEGTDLERWLSVHPFDEAEVISIMRELCDVIGYLHSRSPPVLHRDLKPANIVRRSDGRLSLVDFGASREGIAQFSATTVVGTAGYMAPEQLRGNATHRSDLYGLGALAVALLTGREMASMLGRDWAIDRRSHVSVSPEFGQLLDEMLAAIPEQRPPHIEAVRERLDRLAIVPYAPSAGAVLLAAAAIAWSMVLMSLLVAGGLTLLAAVSVSMR